MQLLTSLLIFYEFICKLTNLNNDLVVDLYLVHRICIVALVMSQSLVQYVIIRGDLLKHLSWPTGAVIAQACHACSAALWLFREDSNTIEYTKELDRMHKVVLEVIYFIFIS